ncbi:MAG TPA: hypothetical protein VM221_11745 [Armatimonadota bacterium]|nr:hypothetical protein [Armatimonadota bacterium]
MTAITPTPAPPAIGPEEVAVVVDRLMPVVLRYLDEHPLASQTYYAHFMALTVLLSQYADRHSQHHGKTELLTRAWREIEHELGKPQPQWPAYGTLFELSEFFDCYRAAEGVLPESQLAQLRELFRPLGECLLAEGSWDFSADDRVNPALLRAANLGVCGYLLGDERMRAESRAQAEAIFARCDEHDVPSELSMTYYAHTVAWALPACEVEPRPDLLRLIAGMCRLIPMLIYEPTLELMGPDCRDQWKLPCRKSVDKLVLGLRGAAVLLSDEGSEWLSRTLFHKWVRDAKPDSAVYSPRAPRYIGVERYDMGYGAADSPEQIAEMALHTGAMLCALKRWLGPEVAARKPTLPDEYRSSKLYLRRCRKGKDMAAVANIIQPLSYMTPTVGLQGIELWSDDRFFWFNLCGFRPTTFSEDGDGFAVPQAPHPASLTKKAEDATSDRIVHGAAKYGEHLLSLTKIDCSQELVPGIVSWAGLLLVADKEGEVIFGRGEEIGRGQVLEEQSNCDWILYPCDGERLFGFGIVALDTTGRSHRLSNFSGDWCVLGLSQSAEPIQGLQALAVLAIGPWKGTPEEYAAWLRAWQVTASPEGCALVAPEGREIEMPFPPPA